MTAMTTARRRQAASLTARCIEVLRYHVSGAYTACPCCGEDVADQWSVRFDEAVRRHAATCDALREDTASGPAFD